MAYDAIQQYLQMQKSTIVSVWPEEKRSRVRLATLKEYPQAKDPRRRVRLTGFTLYVLPAAPKGRFSVLTVTGATDIGTDYSSDEPEALPRPVESRIIAEELVRGWTLSMLKASVELGPGIWVAATPDPADDEILASQHFLDQSRRQERYFSNLIDDGDQQTARGHSVTPLHRLAARYMGTEDCPWVKEITVRRTKLCAACANTIMATALVCEHCHVNLVEFGITNPGEIMQEVDPFVWQRMQTRIAQTVAASTPPPMPMPPPRPPQPQPAAKGA